MNTLTVALMFVLAVVAAPSHGCPSQQNGFQIRDPELLNRLEQSHSNTKAHIASALELANTPERANIILTLVAAAIQTAVETIIEGVGDPLVVCGGGNVTIALCNDISLEIVRVAPGISVTGLSSIGVEVNVVDDSTLEVELTIDSLEVDFGTTDIDAIIFTIDVPVELSITATVTGTTVTLTVTFPDLTNLANFAIGTNVAVGTISFDGSLIVAGLNVSSELLAFLGVVSSIITALSDSINDAVTDIAQGLLDNILS